MCVFFAMCVFTRISVTFLKKNTTTGKQMYVCMYIFATYKIKCYTYIYFKNIKITENKMNMKNTL